MSSKIVLVFLFSSIGAIFSSSLHNYKNSLNKICHLNLEENKMNCTELNLKHKCGSYFCALDKNNCQRFLEKKSNQRINSVSECRSQEEISKPGEKPFYGNTICQRCIDWPNLSDSDGIKLKYKYPDLKIECRHNSCSEVNRFVHDCGLYCSVDEKACKRLNSWWKIKTAFYRFKKC